MSDPSALHPRQALFEPEDTPPDLPVCDHYCGVEKLMRKSLQLQCDMGPVFDVTLDLEDGAPVGGELDHAELISELVMGASNQFGRVGARLPPVGHPLFLQVLDVLVQRAGSRLAYLMLPKPRGLVDVERAAHLLNEARLRVGLQRAIPLHALIETHGALLDVQHIAAHAQIESLSFGVMDFVAAHRGAIPQWGMGVVGQFEHPLVVRAKLEIAAACHARAKVPSHCVVTEFKDSAALQEAASKAARRFGYTRMWSIHPAQIRPIVDAFAPTAAEVDQAIDIIHAAQAAQWAPIRHKDTLHDRASYRYFWQVLERAHRTSFVGGAQLPFEVTQAFFTTPTP